MLVPGCVNAAAANTPNDKNTAEHNDVAPLEKQMEEEEIRRN